MGPGLCFFGSLVISFFSYSPFYFFREEIPITLSDSFTITIPIDNNEQSTESDCGEDVAICFSGQSLSLLTDPNGCEVLITFSTLFSLPLFSNFKIFPLFCAVNFKK